MSIGFGGGNLGGAQFVVTANTAGFASGLKQAQVTATRTAQVMTQQLQGMGTNTTASLNAATKAAQGLNAQMMVMGRNSSRAGLGLMAIGNMVDDMQYGFRSIVNNIPQVVYMMGGSAGMAGGAAIAAVAVNQLVQRWGQLTDMMQSAWLNVPANDLEKLRIRAEKATEAFDKLSKAPSRIQGKQIDILTEAIQEGPMGKMLEGVFAGVVNNPALAEPDVDPEVKRQARLWGGKAALQNLEKRRDEANREKAKQIIGQSLIAGPEGDSGRQILMSMIKKNPGNFPPALVGAIQKASPEEIERLHQEQKQSELLGSINKVLERDERFQRAAAGQAKAGGPAASAETIKKVLEESGLQRHFTPEAMKRMILEMRGAGLNEGQARDAVSLLPWLMGQDKTMTERMMVSPTGRKLLLGGFPEPKGDGGPMDERGIMGILGGQRMLRNLPRNARERMAREMAGLTDDQVKDVLSGLTPQAVLERSRKIFEEKNRWNAAHGIDPLSGSPNQFAQEAERKLFEERLGAAKAQVGPPKPREDPLIPAVAAELERLGESGDPKAIARGMREEQSQRVKKIMAEQGVNRNMARFMVAQQSAFTAFPQLNQPAQWVGLTQKAKSLSTNALNMPTVLPELARQQLKELTQIRLALALMAQKAKPMPQMGQLPP